MSCGARARITCPDCRSATTRADVGRRIADQLGQAKVSITQDIYVGRQAANPAAAQALQHAFDDPDLL